MPTGNLPQSVMTFFVISWASVFLQCEFKFCVSPCGELPRAWLMIHDITFGRGFGLCTACIWSLLQWVKGQETHSVLWALEILCPAGWGHRHMSLVCASLDLSGMNNVWNSDGVAGEIISRSTLIKQMLFVTLSLYMLKAFQRNHKTKYIYIYKNVFLTNRLRLKQWKFSGWNDQKQWSTWMIPLIMT